MTLLAIPKPFVSKKCHSKRVKTRLEWHFTSLSNSIILAFNWDHVQNLIVGFKILFTSLLTGWLNSELRNEGISARLCSQLTSHSERNLKVTSVEFESEVSSSATSESAHPKYSLDSTLHSSAHANYSYSLRVTLGYSDTFPSSRGCHCKRGNLYMMSISLSRLVLSLEDQVDDGCTGERGSWSSPFSRTPSCHVPRICPNSAKWLIVLEIFVPWSWSAWYPMSIWQYR